MADLKQRAGEEDSGAKEKAERDARWVGEWSDELTVAIALREWEKAVVLVEDGKKPQHSYFRMIDAITQAKPRPLLSHLWRSSCLP